VRRKHVGHRAVAATGFPDRAAQADMPEQRLGDPIRSGVEVPPLPVVAGIMDGAALCRPGGRWRQRSDRGRADIEKR
jgi:hypothetical protein